MKPVSVAIHHWPAPSFDETVRGLTGTGLVEEVVVVSSGTVPVHLPGCRLVVSAPLASGETLRRLVEEIRTPYLLVLPSARQVTFGPGGLERLIGASEETGAGMAYADFLDRGRQGHTIHPLIDYQKGSVRDDFDFGGALLFSVPAVRKVLDASGPRRDTSSAGLYDLRLKLSVSHSIHHVAEPLYSLLGADEGSDGDRLFAYVDPRNQAAQKEMEAVFTDYLGLIGAYLPPGRLKRVEQASGTGGFPVMASVVIPVRNRAGTVADAVRSAASQATDFPFNVIVVNNHSTDGTTALLADLARREDRLVHIIPSRTDLGIGGCWNEAIHAEASGRFAVQLDSDDLYEDTRALQRMVDCLREGGYALAIGAYTLVNERLEEIPPGLVDHREWTDANGHNNALRINGLGAPRAFDTGIIRTIGFPNVSYGEDYAAALRVCREYRIGRVFESVYLCRRWAGNTDTALTIEQANRNNVFKDSVRTAEITARQEMNRGAGESDQ